MIIYTDGSCKYGAGWAWCASNGRFGYGADPNPLFFNHSMFAELLSVINALRSIDVPNITLYNDCTNLIDWVNGIKNGSFNRSKIKESYIPLLNELEKLKASRNICAKTPKRKNKGVHRWCHIVSRAVSPTKKCLTEFEDWYREQSQKLDKNSAFYGWFASRIKYIRMDRPIYHATEPLPELLTMGCDVNW